MRETILFLYFSGIISMIISYWYYSKGVGFIKLVDVVIALLLSLIPLFNLIFAMFLFLESKRGIKFAKSMIEFFNKEYKI